MKLVAMKAHKQVAEFKPGERFLFEDKQLIVTDKKPLCVEVYTGKVRVVPSTTWVKQV